MTRNTLVKQIFEKKSFLCVGLDSELSRIPEHLLGEKDPVFEFNKQIIDATRDLCVAYKPNTAFYEAQGVKGWRSLQRTIRYIGKKHLVIADAKRGDIGNTSRLYAEAFFNQLKCSAITVAPYMGVDSVQPFLEFPKKWVILLALTSNKGSADFQQNTQNGNAQKLFENVLLKSQEWGTPNNLMYVVGATHPEAFQRIRALVPKHFLLVPGVGAQGGNLQAICEYGMNKDCGLLVNSSRGIIFASSGEDFAEAARAKALVLQEQMAELLIEKK